MKYLYLIVLSVVLVCAGCHSDLKDEEEKTQEEMEVSLYDENKKAIAYIDFNDEATIYMFDGEPVAYIETEDEVYGFNGKHLGWYVNGVLYDMTHHAVGAKQGIERGGLNTVITSLEKMKGVKHVKPVKSVKSVGHVRPYFIDTWSEMSLTDFLAGGKKHI